MSANTSFVDASSGIDWVRHSKFNGFRFSVPEMLCDLHSTYGTIIKSKHCGEFVKKFVLW